MKRYGELSAPMVPIAQAYAEKVCLDVDWTDPDAMNSKLAVISQTPEVFDYPAIPTPERFHYTGPFHDDGGREPVPFAWNKLDGRPLIYASLGTIVNDQDSIHQAILGAVAGFPDVQLVFSVGKNASLDDLGPIPPNTIVVPVAPQLELLERAALCVTHAGLNTTLEALARGVPLVAIPIGYDQPGVAARVAYHGVGEFVDIEGLTAEHLARLIRVVLDDPSYRDRARSFQRSIAAANGLEVASDLIERAFRIGARATGIRPARAVMVGV
jgi:zeaxanthin glucosyltransferase